MRGGDSSFDIIGKVCGDKDNLIFLMAFSSSSFLLTVSYEHDV